MEPWIWAALVLVLALALIVVEVFIPSGGIIGFLACACLVTALVLAFRQSATTGFIFLAIAMFGVPAAFATALHFFPGTPVGKWILLDVPKSDEVLPDDERRRALRELVGKVGVAKSLMLPSGVIKIEGRTVDAVSEGMSIEAGQSVYVVEVRGNRVVVRPTDDGYAPDADDALSKPIDSLGLDPFEDPLA